jgi:hypothetical protein
MNLRKLKALAAAATPGPYEYEVPFNVIHSTRRLVVARFASTIGGESTARYLVAATPEYVAKLIACIEAADAMCATKNFYCTTYTTYEAARAAIEEEQA